MSTNVLGGGVLDGSLGVNPTWASLTIPLGRVVQSLSSGLTIDYHIVQSVQVGDGKLLKNGLYANPAKLTVVASVSSVNNKFGDVVLSKGDVGLGNVDNTSDLGKPVSTATDNEIRKVRTLALVGL